MHGSKRLKAAVIPARRDRRRLCHQLKLLGSPSLRVIAFLQARSLRHLICGTHVTLIHRVGDKKFAHILKEKNITTQSRGSSSPYCHLDARFRLGAYLCGCPKM